MSYDQWICTLGSDVQHAVDGIMESLEWDDLGKEVPSVCTELWLWKWRGKSKIKNLMGVGFVGRRCGEQEVVISRTMTKWAWGGTEWWLQGLELWGWLKFVLAKLRRNRTRGPNNHYVSLKHHLEYLAHCLGHSKCSINVGKMNEWGTESVEEDMQRVWQENIE